MTNVVAKRTFIIILVLGLVLSFLPSSIKLVITKYPRIVFLLPLDGLNKFVTYFHLRQKEFRKLHELAIRLSLENALLIEKIPKNQLLNLNRPDITRVNIIARDNETGVRFLTINKGTYANLKVNMPVLTAQGVVGKIIETNDNYSLVETALSPGLKISACDQRSQVNGIIEYSNLSNLRFKYAFSESDILIGDTIITSGLGGIFPRRLNIGIVNKVQTDPTRYFQYVEVKPMVNFNTIYEIFVLTTETTPFEEFSPENNTRRILNNLKIDVPITPRMR